ncbi:hypothetical protein BBJ29_009559 [Phytophthora kernoviae]|uniref:Uncharacterized protein n=1 Tax=Phytophthora kernoviae TaxID=325452 RepID=A0A3R7JI37_9STRA|nr:hypothetical protein BBJ29_009559 [Phytophthora kernoviae]
MARKVWFQLVDAATRGPFLDHKASSVPRDSVNDIEDLRNKIHAKYDHTRPQGTDILAQLTADQLDVYANRTVYDDKDGQPLDPRSLLNDLDVQATLIVEVPTQHLVPRTVASVVGSRELSTPYEPRDSQIVVNGVTIHVTENMALNPPALVDFWKAFQAIRTEVEADAVIALPEETFLLGDLTQGSRIYIRRCYPKLLNVCWDMIHDEATNTPHLVILGNPGIGKTFFGYVILLHLARLGATVVYESGGSQQRFLFSHASILSSEDDSFDIAAPLHLCFVDICLKDMCIQCFREVERFEFGAWSTTMMVW